MAGTDNEFLRSTRKMKFHFILVSNFVAGFLCAQPVDQLKLKFQPVFGSAPLELNRSYFTSAGDSIRVGVLKFYISGIEFHSAEGPEWKEENSYHLLDLSDTNSLRIDCKLPRGFKFDRMKFYLGIDSLTNASGARGGALDPTRGMYWAWQSGYIHFKLEGTSNLCPAPSHQFQFHLGGFIGRDQTLQEIIQPLSSGNDILIEVDIEKFMSGLDLAKQNHLMSPGREAVMLSEKAAKIFRLIQK